MYRIDTANSVASLPTPAALGTEEFFEDGVVGTDGTLLEADWLNMVQESLLAIVDESGRGHSKSNYSNFLLSLTDVIDARLGGLVTSARGHCSGLIFTGTAAAGFDISVGSCRDVDDGATLTNSSTRSKVISSSWNETTGALASGNTIGSGPYYGRIFIIGKSTDSAASDIGVDTSPTAANLLADAASAGFDLHRQIGWAIHGVYTGDLQGYEQDPNTPGYWRILEHKVSGPTALAGTASKLTDVEVPEDGVFIGTIGVHTVDSSSNQNSAVQIQQGTGKASRAAAAGPQLFQYEADSSENQITETGAVTIPPEAGTATNQGALRSRGQDEPTPQGDPEVSFSPTGFWWDRAF